MAQDSNKFSSRLGFLAAAAGSSVGLYNMWRIPYELSANGGGAFLLVYIICVICLGYPLVTSELALGRDRQTDIRTACTQIGGKWWGLIGILPIVTVVMILSFYNMVIGWILTYFVMTFRENLLASADFSKVFEEVISQPGNNLFYTFIASLLGALIVKDGVQDGLERWSKILMPLFLVMLLGLIGYALTLENAWAGVHYLLVPKLSLLTASTIFKACGQSLGSLSVGMGILVTYGVYLPKKDHLSQSAFLITASDTIISVLAGLIIFPFMFHKQLAPAHGPALVFVSLPLVFQSLGSILGMLIGGSFFALLALAAITSSISMLESAVQYVMRYARLNRLQATCSLGIAIYLMSILSIYSFGGSEWLTHFWVGKEETLSFFDLLDRLTNYILIPLGSTLLSYFLAYRWGKKRLFNAIQGDGAPMSGWFKSYIHVTVILLAPIALTINLLLIVGQLFY